LIDWVEQFANRLSDDLCVLAARID
jgi:hypothetical protein